MVSLFTLRLLLVVAIISTIALSGNLTGHACANDDEFERKWVLPNAEQLSAQRDLIRRAAIQVDRRLASAPEGPRWRDYLLWEALQDAISPEADEDSVRQLDALSDLLSVYNRMTDDHPGLEWEPFRLLHRAIRVRIRQLNALVTLRGPAESSARRARMNSILNAAVWTGESQSEWAQHLRWLDDRVQELPEYSFNPVGANLYVRLSAPFIRDATMTRVFDPTHVNECIVGTRIVGSGITNGHGWLSPAPSSSGARLTAHFQGALQSNTVGYNGPVQIYSDGYTQLVGTAALNLNADGVQVLGFAVNASATSTTKGVSTKFHGIIDGFVQKIAYRQIAKKQAQADLESSQKAQASFRARFDADVARQVSDGNQSYQRYLRLPLERRDTFPELWSWTSKSSALISKVQFDGRQRPPAMTAPPKVRVSNDIHLVVHQSFCDNTAETYLAGRLIALDELLAPGHMGVPAAPDRVLIRLDDFQPLRCVFDDNVMTLHLLGRQFVAGSTEYPAAVIKVRYRLAATAVGMKLHRVGDPVVLPTPRFASPARFGIGGTALRASIEPALRRGFPQVIDLKLPKGYAELPDAISHTQVVHADTKNGWLHIAMDTSVH